MTAPLDPASVADVQTRVAGLRQRIAAAAERAGREAAGITLVGAAKRQPIDRVAAAVLAGVTDLGHNYVQEAQAMREALVVRLREVARPGAGVLPVRWHMIGHLQRNKAAAAVDAFDSVDAVDSAKLARALDRHAGGAGRTLEIGVQVNLTGEAQKSGVDAQALPELLEVCAALAHVRVVSLMTMPRASDDPEEARPVFAALRRLRDRLRESESGRHLQGLSMGMSGDYEIAIEEGATLVRVGTALFGERETPARADPAPATTALHTTSPPKRTEPEPDAPVEETS